MSAFDEYGLYVVHDGIDHDLQGVYDKSVQAISDRSDFGCRLPVYSLDREKKSVFQIQWFMKLKPEEAVAINCHMGFSDGNINTIRDVSNAYHQFPLAWIVHVADEAATFLLDR